MSDVLPNGNAVHLIQTSRAVWVEIQKNTFKNWVNEQLTTRGLSIVDLRTDFDDGVNLVALVESLRRKKIPGLVAKPTNNIEKLHNITKAIDAIADDNVTLINIDSNTFTEGNVKLILAFIWQLILRYQIGLSNIQHRSWLLAWLQAVIPECNITNLTTDWNSGIALHALLEFCKPGLCPRWRQMDPGDSVNNCRNAMKIARQHYGIPLILRPEDLASSELDELSAITYLSYFTRVGAPGYNTTLQRIQPLVKTTTVCNFTTDWNDGRVLCELVKTLGGRIYNWPEMKGNNIQRLQEGLDAAQELGVEPLLTAADVADEDSEHLGIMAYAGRFINLKPDIRQYTNSYNETEIIMTTQQERVVHTLPKANSVPQTNSVPKTNTVRSDPPQEQLTYNLVRTPSLRRKRKEVVQVEEGIAKKDTYSDGVIIFSTSHTLLHADDVTLKAESPTGRIINMNGDGEYHAPFAPDEIGVWHVALYINDRLVEKCNVEVCDPSQVRLSGITSGRIGKRHEFKADCSRAGNGSLEVTIDHDGIRVPVFVSEPSPRSYRINYTPISSGLYNVRVMYNRAEIRDDINSSAVDTDLQRQAVFSTVIKPHHDYFKVEAKCDWQIDYMTGGPFKIFHGDSADVRVFSMQDGTICNVPHIIADCSNAPGGKLEAEVSYNTYRFPPDIIEDSPNVYRVVFQPRGPGTYKVWLIYDGTLIKGSPFIQEIAELTSPSADGPGLSRGCEGQPCTFKIDARGFPGALSVDVEGPHFPISNTIVEEPDKTHTVTYVPEECGIHRINIKLDGKDIKGSPYHPKIVDPTRVRVSGGWRPLLDDQERIPLTVGKEKHIPFDATDAGPGQLTANIRGPSDKVPVTVDSRGDGKHTVIFTPREEGKHYIEVFWNGFPLENTPYLGYAIRRPDVPEPDYAVTNIVPVTRVREPKRDSSPPRVEVTHVRQAPPQQYSPPRIDVYDPNTPYILSNPTATYPYTGRPTRVYQLSPRHQQPVVVPTTVYYDRPQSPPRITLLRHGSDVSSTASHKIRRTPKRTASMHSGTTNNTSEPEIMLYRLPREPVEYRYEVSPRSSTLPSRDTSYKGNRPTNKPSSVSSDSPKGPHPKVILRGKGLKEGQVNKPARFSIDGRNAGAGEPWVKVASVRHPDVPVNIEPDGPKQYNCTYYPPEPGSYLLDIKWNDRPLKVCPFKVNVHKHKPGSPRIDVTGHPLQSGVVGKDIDLKIDPRKYGKGFLTVYCTGPHGQEVPVKVVDNPDGTFHVKVIPQEPGRHVLEIKYNNQHIHGSPYALDIKTSQVIGPVKVYGPGLESGVFPTYEGYFWVDARGAGSGELHVSVMGPKGAFQVEMKRASQKDKLFNCRYNPIEPGIYTINVQWSGMHVEGSPYRVHVAASEGDLEFDKASSMRSSVPPSQPVPDNLIY